MKILPSLRYLATVAIGMMVATQAAAHAAEQGFVLLLPTTLYIVCGTLAVALSIGVVALSPTRWVAGLFAPRAFGQARSVDRAQTLVSLCGTFGFAGLIAVGLFGPSDPQDNLLPLVIWTVWWIGLVGVQAIIGDVWRWINPWAGLHRLAVGESLPPFKLPLQLGVWPAIILLIGFNIFAIADIAPSDPRRLASFALAYWGFTFLGMLAFGASRWLAQVECFTVFFRLLARLAPVERSDRWGAGVPGWRCMNGGCSSLSIAIFCIVLLAMGSFDGLHETFWWLAQIGVNPLEFPGRSAVFWSSTLGLIGACILLVAIFAVAVWAGTHWTHTPFKTAFCAFAITLLPIAFGYHIAHFLVTFLVQGQYVIAALGDPLGQGANMLGLADWPITTGFLAVQTTVRVIWLVQAAAVVGSHVLAVLMAHHMALRIFASPREVITGQAGIAVLMVAYTVFGLWLLASPRGV